MSTDHELNSSSLERWFYVWAAAICVVLILVTFAPSYWLQLPARTVEGFPGLHLHALLFASWPLLFLLQSWFVATNQIRRHRAWGLAGISLATAMVFSGVDSVIRELEHSIASGHTTAPQFTVGPILWLMLFAGFFIAAIVYLKRPDIHKRMLLLATISLMPPAVAHVFFSVMIGDGPGIRPGLAGPAPVEALVTFALIADLLIIGPMIFDWKTRGRPHAAYVIGSTIMVLVHLSVIPLHGSDIWRRIISAMAGV